MKIQVMQSKGMFSQSPVAGFLRPKMARLIMHTPIGQKITRRIAFGNPAASISAGLSAEPARARMSPCD